MALHSPHVNPESMVWVSLAQQTLAGQVMNLLWEEAQCCLLVGAVCCHFLLTSLVLIVHLLVLRFAHW